MTEQDKLQERLIKSTVDFFKSNNKGYLDVAMRGGKTRISIEWFKTYPELNPRILIAYPDNRLLDTWKDECIKWGYLNPNITYTNFSSLKKQLDQEFDIFVCDEFHSLSPNEADLASKVDSIQYLYLSGTVTKETKDKWKDFKEISKYTTLEGIEKGILADYTITVHLVPLDTVVKTANKKGKLLSEKQKYDAYSWVINKNKKEGKPTMHLALARNRLSLSSIGKIEYTKKLLKKLSGKRILVFTGLADVADQFTYSYHSKSIDDSDYQSFFKKETHVLALAAMGKVGVTYPDLDSVILLNFTYNKEESAQILNRAIKLDYQGKIADLHVICLDEEPEIKKVKESLSMLDSSKIKYI